MQWARILLAVFSILLVGALSQQASASEIQVHKGADGFDIITIFGDIELGDDERFNQIAVASKASLVILGSEGGSLIPALEIGRTIQIRGYSTYVPADNICTSSCALMWIAGTNRMVSQTARVGFHASYRNNNGASEEVGVANAMVGRYLTLLNLPERAVIFATSASPYEIMWLTRETANQSGIVFEYFDLDETDSDRPQTVAPPPINVAPAGSVSASSESSDLPPVKWFYSGASTSGSEFL